MKTPLSNLVIAQDSINLNSGGSFKVLAKVDADLEALTFWEHQEQ